LPMPTHVVFTLQADRFGSMRPTFDITGRIGSGDRLFYRLNAEISRSRKFARTGDESRTLHLRYDAKRLAFILCGVIRLGPELPDFDRGSEKGSD
jgi:hypothetical protein